MSPSRDQAGLFKAKRGSNQSSLRGKGPTDYSLITVDEMIRD